MNIKLELPEEVFLMSRHELKGMLEGLISEHAKVNEIRRVMTIGEVAEYLKVSIPTVRKLIAEKEIPYFQKGQIIRIFYHDVQLWLEMNKQSKQDGISNE